MMPLMGFLQDSDTGLGSLFAWTGWLVALLLAGLLLLLVWRWRTAFETKEWLLVPSLQASRLVERMEAVEAAATAMQKRVAAGMAKQADAVGAVTANVQEARGEFAILAEDLERKAREIKDLRMGHEFHSRRPVLRAVAHALQIIEEDAAGGVEPRATLEGIHAELLECLENHAVSRVVNAPGTRLADARGVSVRDSTREAAPADDRKGTIGETLRSAYVAAGLGGEEEVLIQSKVRIYV